MADVGRELWKSSGAISLLNQDLLEPVAQDHIEIAFEYLQAWRLQLLNILQFSGTFMVKKKFPDVQMESPGFQFVP